MRNNDNMSLSIFMVAMVVFSGCCFCFNGYAVGYNLEEDEEIVEQPEKVYRHGYIDSARRERLIIDDMEYRLSSNLHSFDENGNTVDLSAFKQGSYVGFVLDSTDMICELKKMVPEDDAMRPESDMQHTGSQNSGGPGFYLENGVWKNR